MVTIRPAGAADIPELLRLRLAYFREEFGELPPDALADISAQIPAYLRAHMGRDCFCYCADRGEGTLCASCILCVMEKPANPFFPTGKSGEVLGVYTEPAMRRQGLATRLMAMLTKDAEAMGLDVVRLSASAMGRPVYESLGYRAAASHDTPMEMTFYPHKER